MKTILLSLVKNLLVKLRKRFFPTEEDIALVEIERDLIEAEIYDWVKHYIEDVVKNGGDVSDEFFKVWYEIDEYQKGLAFHYAIGMLAGMVSEYMEEGSEE